MAGHSRWKNIKHKKAASDAKRGKMWSKCAKAIMVAAKGGSDPSSNLALRYAVDEARYANMPRDTIERSIKKGAGELGAENYENVRYEGYGPGGVAVIVDALTNNRTRTAADLRLIFGKFGGNLGTSGSVGYMFDTRGIIMIAGKGLDGDRAMELALEAGAMDVSGPDGEDDEQVWTLLTAPTQFHAVKEAVERLKATVVEASIGLIPNIWQAAHEDAAVNVGRLVESLEDNDDVQRVHTNLEGDGESGVGAS